MAYRYCVIWFTKAKSWISGKPRPTYSECKMFHKLEKAIEFSKEWAPPALIYELKVVDEVKSE